MRAPSKNCALCEKPVSTLGAFAQLSQGKLAHASCVESVAYESGYQAGRRAVLYEQTAENLRMAQAQAEKARVEWERLPRCSRCGKKIGEGRLSNFGEVAQPSSVVGVCGPCVREEIRARAQATSNMPVTQEKKDAPKEEATKRDRFQLLDID